MALNRICPTPRSPCTQPAWGKLPTMSSESAVRPQTPKNKLAARDWFGSRWASFYGANRNSLSWLSRRPIFHLLIVLIAFLIIFSRRPDAMLNPQFWAEDGQRWYADAYQFGIRCLLIPDELGGYFHSASRLSALVSLIFPFSLAPLVMNLCAIAIQILPGSIFLSSRFSNIALPKRLAIAFVYFALPNTYEVNANTTTIQWHLGLLAALLLVAVLGPLSWLSVVYLASAASVAASAARELPPARSIRPAAKPSGSSSKTLSRCSGANC